MTSPKTEMSAQSIHDVYSMETTRVTSKAARKRTAANKQSAAVKAVKTAKARSARKTTTAR